MFKKNSFISVFLGSIATAILLFASFIQVQIAYAAALTSLSDTQSSLKISTLSDHTIQFVTPSGVTAGQGITVTFSSNYATGTHNINNIDFATSTSAVCSNFTDAILASGTPSGLTWGVTLSTSTLYITSGTAIIPANRCVQIRIGSNAISQASGTSQIINPTTATTTGATITIGGTFGDTGVITQNILGDDTVSMTGTVNQSLTFTISTTTIFFGTLGAGDDKFASSTNILGDSAETIAHTLGVSTNAPSGFTLSVRGATLTSQQNASNTINAIGASVASSTLGSEQFGIRATESGGTGTSVSSPFNMSTSYGYNATATTSATLATGSGATLTSTYSLRYVANIATLTEAGTYAANLVYVATANF